MDASSIPSESRRGMATADRIGLWVVGVGAGLVALAHAVALVLGVRRTLGDRPLEVAGLHFVEEAAPAFTEQLPAVTEARYYSWTAVVDGLPSLARWLLWGAEAAVSLAAIGICLALIWLCVRVARRRPFGRSLTVALVVTAGLVIIGGMLPQMLDAIARSEVIEYLGVAEMAATQGTAVAFSFEVSLAPVGIGLALGVVAAAFEIGERLQQDTEGLV